MIKAPIRVLFILCIEVIFTDTASMLERFYELYPRRRVLFLNTENERYFEDYLRLNLDILCECLAKTTLDFQPFENGIFIKGDNIHSRLLFECGVFAMSVEDGAVLKPYASACDIMSCACRISSIFQK